MKKTLLFLVASFSVLSGAAQLKTAEPVVLKQPLSVSRVNPEVQVQEMQLRAPGEALSAPRKDSDSFMPYYRRPAGAFYSPMFVVNGVEKYYITPGVLQLKPYSDYTYYSVVDEADDNGSFYWSYSANDEYYGETTRDITAHYGYEITETPFFTVNQKAFQYPYYLKQGVVGDNTEPAKILAISATNPESFGFDENDEVELLFSSKTMARGGRNGDVQTLFVSYYGLAPFGENSNGWWFGKNAGDVDGMAQVFEKPEHSYLLKHIYMDTEGLVCNAPVELTCSVYKFNQTVPYDESGPVFLTDQIGDLIARAKAYVTPQTSEVSGGLIVFTPYDVEDGLEFDVALTIEDAIIVVFDGYNAPEADGLVDFHCSVSADVDADEGYGEMAYMKLRSRDVNGNLSDDALWVGLNKFFGNNTMKTGFTFFISADYPFLLFNNKYEEGEFVFPREGGAMEHGIEFCSWVPSVDDGWILTWNGEEDLPDWLEIELTDGVVDGEFNNLVYAVATADPLPEGVRYREACIRFEIPGAYLDYTFKQADVWIPNPCDDDGELNIADVNRLIFLILNGMYDDCFDLNEDGELNIADINALIKLIFEIY